ncbi:MAG: cupin domain-containing protein [Deltaproteobacteria bacterium]|nr:cupin domain-containing protein [Deltaproteobacteria bacterium]
MADQQKSAPMPEPGQVWHIPDIVKHGGLFVTMLGQPLAPTEPPPPAIPTMSLHVYHLKKGQPDQQLSHQEDEAYYVITGAGKVTVENVTKELREGDLLFVPRQARHHFHDYDDLALLVFFAPQFSLR